MLIIGAVRFYSKLVKNRAFDSALTMLKYQARIILLNERLKDEFILACFGIFTCNFSFHVTW